MKTRKEALKYGLSFADTYQEAPFHDPNWQLVRYKPNRKAFLWTYEKDGYICLNVKTDPAWRDLWRKTYTSVLPAYHQNKEHWNTIILDGSIPDTPEEWLDGFNTFSIYQVLPELIELWGLNVQTEIQTKKNFEQLSGK